MQDDTRQKPGLPGADSECCDVESFRIRRGIGTIRSQSIAVAGQRRGGGATWAEAKAVALGLHGGFAIVKGLGYRLYPSTKSTMYSVPNFLIAFLLWVLSRIPAMRENLATGQNECRALIDTMVAAAAKAQPPLPAAAKDLLAIKPTEESGTSIEVRS